MQLRTLLRTNIRTHAGTGKVVMQREFGSGRFSKNMLLPLIEKRRYGLSRKKNCGSMLTYNHAKIALHLTTET